MSPWKIEGMGLPELIIGYEGQVGRFDTTLGPITVRSTQAGFEIIGDQKGDNERSFAGSEFTDQEGEKGRTIQLPNGQWLTVLSLLESTL